MGTKVEIRDSIAKVYEDYKDVFHLLNMTEELFIRWFSKFEDFNSVRKLNTFFFSGKVPFLKMLELTAERYKYFTPQEWCDLKALTRQMSAVVELNAAIKALKVVWRTRPKPPRRSE